MILKKVSIVVPTIREESLTRFLEEWSNIFFENKEFDINLIIVEDNPKKTFSIKKNPKVSHLCWEDIEADLSEKSWIIPRRTDCVRSYGYWKAYQQKPGMILTLDDDCYPIENYMDIRSDQNLVLQHWNNLFAEVKVGVDAWTNTISKYKPRGYPYENTHKKVIPTNVGISHGLWYNVPDLDGQTQLKMKKTSGLFGYGIHQLIPKNRYYPMCGMNLAWKTELTPIMYFWLMGQHADGNHWGYDRFGDIWCGILSKRILDHLDMSVVSGNPIVWHDRASNPETNMKKESPGMPINEVLWEIVDSVKFKSEDLVTCYREIAKQLPSDSDYWIKQKEAMNLWTTLYKV